jgi:hypothetical protein
MEAGKPLKLLTLDGGGLQAISTLLILDKILNAIAHKNGVSHRKPRPCDVFDTIAGIGAGGWLAILLGRFHMDITTCLSEWYKIIRCIAPRSKGEELRMRAFRHCYFNPDRLVTQIENLTKEYGSGEHLFERGTANVRTRYVFVAALRSDAKDYNLFRSYDIPKSARMPDKLREGPKSPNSFKISRAFGVTGSAKFFSPPWKEQMSKSGGTRFNDNKFPKPHNITELALDEMWGIHGTEVPISVIVNIGPGLPSKCDVHQIARRFSWGLRTPLNSSTYSKRSRSPLTEAGDTTNKRSRLDNENDDPPPPTEGPSVRFQETSLPEQLPKPGDRKSAMARNNTFGSINDRRVKQKLRRLETDIEVDIKSKLNNIYPNGSSLYYRLAPEQAPQGTAQNDSSAPGLTLDATMEFLEQPQVEIRIDEIERRISSSESER